MEKVEFKKIGLPPKTALSDDELMGVSGGKKNIDENGNWDSDQQHCQQWVNDMYHTKFYMRCPKCHREMFYSMNVYTSDTWWYCFWYNRLYCHNCNSWTEELY